MGQVTSMVSRIPNSNGILARKPVTTYEPFQIFSYVFHADKHAPNIWTYNMAEIIQALTWPEPGHEGLPTRQIVASRVEQGGWP